MDTQLDNFYSDLFLLLYPQYVFACIFICLSKLVHSHNLSFYFAYFHLPVLERKGTQESDRPENFF